MSDVCVIRRAVNAAAAHAAVAAAVARAEELGVAINAAVVDSGGVLCAFLRMPDAFLHSVDIAIDKAKTAAGFKTDTGALYQAVKGSRSLELGLIRRDDCALFAGGVVLYHRGEIIGAIGVSGASEEQDLQCAEAGAKAIEELAGSG